MLIVVCDTAKVRFFKQITTRQFRRNARVWLFAILQKYDFSSKSQPYWIHATARWCCLRYCKSTIFQANHNKCNNHGVKYRLFAILQKYDFSSKSQPEKQLSEKVYSCLRYCKSTIFQANHNDFFFVHSRKAVVCDTAKVRFFKQITTHRLFCLCRAGLFAILQKYDFSSKSQRHSSSFWKASGCLRYCKSTIFQANHNWA